MVPRTLEAHLRVAAGRFPVVTVVGPRQSGKSTLVRATFPAFGYINLERPDHRDAAIEDPRGLLARWPSGLILDEVRNVPALLSWIQADVDEDPRRGRYVLTGSNQHALSAAIAQSLAGRTDVSVLLPPDRTELLGFSGAPTELWATVWSGGFPRIFDAAIPADAWLASYVATYLERDVRAILNVVDRLAFSTFLKLAAARTGQELNLSALGADSGITQPTARAWLSVLEASYLAMRLPAWHRNTRKQLIKAPKLHLVDTGLVSFLLGCRTPDELRGHPLRGAVFETWVTTEIWKQRVHRGITPRLAHWREARGLEVDLVVDDGPVLWLVECKSGATVASDWFGPLRAAVDGARADHPEREVRGAIVYGGDVEDVRHAIRVVPWHAIGAFAPEGYGLLGE